ncbi:hypothetical protein I4U23_004329 [Adineta vaga]|nr:hypothetical protein I4U23_004329 [Adineta vaga]
MSFAASLSIVQQYMTRYGMTTYVILGSIGSFFNILMFSQTQYRRTPCALYILAMSISGIWGLNVSAVPVIWGLDYPSPFLYNQVSCGMFFYFRHSLNQMLRTFFVLVCIDRYACCSDRARIRAFSQYKVAIRLIPAVWLFWFLVCIFPTAIRTLSNGVCDAKPGVYDIIYTVYIISTTGILPLLGMVITGILMFTSLRKMRRRVVPATSSETGTAILRKRDRDMMKMLFIELVICMCTLSPNTITHIYKTATTHVVRTKERQQIESFFYFLSRLFLLYMANTFSFWVYISTSQTYRMELKNLFIKWYRFIMRK